MGFNVSKAVIKMDQLNLLNRYQGLVFDLDGTLVNSMQFHILAWQEVGLKRKVNIPAEYLSGNGGRPSILIAAELKKLYNFTDAPELLQREKTANYIRHLPDISIYPQMKVLLDYAQMRQLKLVIGTGTLRSNVEAVMKHTGLDHYIEKFVCSADVSAHKPHPDTFLKSAQLISCNPGDCLVFEDAPLGIEAASRGGMDCCVVTDGNFDLAEIIKNSRKDS